jgi:hypothetical protein
MFSLHIRKVSKIALFETLEEMDLICESAGLERQLYRRIEDCSRIFVKSILLRDLILNELIAKELEKLIERLINLYHPCLTALIGFVFASGSRELTILVDSNSKSESNCRDCA